MKIRKRKKTFVLVMPCFEDIFGSFYAGEIIKGVTRAASRHRIDILIHITDRKDHRGWLDSSLLDPRFIDGILFGDIDNDFDVVKKAISKGIPTLVLNNFFEQPLNCISIDNYHATYLLVKHFIKGGHKRIATICGDLSTQAGIMRLRGFQNALQDSGVRIPTHFVAKGDFMRSVSRSSSLKLLKSKNRPTAIFAASDVMALETIDVAKKCNLDVPGDLSIIGFDDNPLNVHSPVKLSTVAQPLDEMGRLGVEKLNLITKGQMALPVKIVLPARVRYRKSDKAFNKK